MAITLLTVGHGTSSAEEFADRLRGAGVEHLVDVRIGPGSRRNPHFGRDELARWLPEAGVSYEWEQRLGGFRKLPPGSPDPALRNSSFRAYAAHMRTEDFEQAMAEVLEGAAGRRTVVMCSESVWWRCHRRLIADWTELLHEIVIEHVMPGGRTMPHRPTDGVRIAEGTLVYDAMAGE